MINNTCKNKKCQHSRSLSKKSVTVGKEKDKKERKRKEDVSKLCRETTKPIVGKLQYKEGMKKNEKIFLKDVRIFAARSPSQSIRKQVWRKVDCERNHRQIKSRGVGMKANVAVDA